MRKGRFYRWIWLLAVWTLPLAAQAASTIPVTLGVTIPVETMLNRTIARPAVAIWLEMIREAKRSLDIGEFYLSAKPGEPLDQVVEAVLDASKRGVRVRILTDAKMAGTYPDLIARFRKAGIALRLFDWRKKTGGVLHAKYMIADGNVLWLGSQNFDWRALKHIHETGIRVDHPAFGKAASRIFERDWAEAGREPDPFANRPSSTIPFPSWGELVASPASSNPPGIDAALPRLIDLIDGAKRQITIQLLSYSTGRRNGDTFPAIDDALRRAAKRGVQVRMMVSHWNKRHPEALQALSQVPGIDVRFVTIPESHDGFIPFARVIHSKVMRVDDRVCWVGTSNWAYDYFFASRNLEVIIRDRTLAKQLDRLFNDLWQSPYTERVQVGVTYPAPRLQ